MHFDSSTLTSPPGLIVLIAVVIIILAIAIAFAVRRHKMTTMQLRNRFGPEYDQAVREDRDSRKAEARLLARVKRVRHFQIRDLSEAGAHPLSRRLERGAITFRRSPPRRGHRSR